MKDMEGWPRSVILLKLLMNWLNVYFRVGFFDN